VRRQRTGVDSAFDFQPRCLTVLGPCACWYIGCARARVQSTVRNPPWTGLPPP